MNQVELGGSALVAVVDAADIDLVSPYKWFAAKDHRTHYGVTHVWVEGKRTTLRMHKLILPGGRVDHIDGNGLNNRRSNLRLASTAQNGANRRSSAHSSMYKGVTFARRDAGFRRSRWQAMIQVDGRSRWLGYFDDEVQAALAYNEAALAAFGEFALLNDVAQ